MIIPEQFQPAPAPTCREQCPICIDGSATLPTGIKCPACNKGTVMFELGERVALRWIETKTTNDASEDGRRYRFLLARKPAPSMPENLDRNAAAVWSRLNGTSTGYVVAGSTDRAMALVREAAVWDKVPRPFTIEISRAFVIEDEVIQKTREIKE